MHVYIIYIYVSASTSLRLLPARTGSVKKEAESSTGGMHWSHSAPPLVAASTSACEYSRTVWSGSKRCMRCSLKVSSCESGCAAAAFNARLVHARFESSCDALICVMISPTTSAWMSHSLLRASLAGNVVWLALAHPASLQHSTLLGRASLAHAQRRLAGSAK